MVNGTRGTLRIFSAALSPAEISERLSLLPTEAFERGTQMSIRNPASVVRDKAAWFLESGLPASSSVEDHIGALMNLVEDRAQEFASLKAQCNIDIFLGCSIENGQGGFTLESGLLERIAATPLDLNFDLYA